MLVHDHNPLTDFKLLYGTGAMRFNDATNAVEWHRGLKYTIKDGVIYDTAELLADVRDLVKESWAEDVPARFAAQPAEGGGVTRPTGPDFVVLTGFLGSGKTTLLRDFLAGPEAADTAVIVNEAGEIGLDGVILREGGGDTPIAMLSNGCICCQAGSDLAYTVDRLLRPSGRARPGRCAASCWRPAGCRSPGPCCASSASLATHRLRVSVLATFDATRGTETAAFEEAAAQWAAAHRIVVTKADAVPPDALVRVRNEIAALNPLSEIVAVADRDRAVAAAFAPLAGIAPMPAPPQAATAAAHPRIAVRLARPDMPSSPTTISRPGSTISRARWASGCCA